MIKILRKSISAGFLIGLSGYISLMCDNKYISAMLFCVGLYTICFYSLNLYTGMTGYLWNNKRKRYISTLCLTLIGNIIGCVIISICPLPQNIYVELQGMIAQKTIGSAIFESFLCGSLMFIAVDMYKTNKNPTGIFLAVPAFILSGMEHSIANTYYLLASKEWDFIPYILICIIGNTMGAIFTNILIKGKQ